MNDDFFTWPLPPPSESANVDTPVLDEDELTLDCVGAVEDSLGGSRVLEPVGGAE